MTDRELLELAAKAAGIVGKWERRPEYIQERWYFNVPYDNQGMLTGFEWNPLTDDGDALRLLIALPEVSFDINDGCPVVAYPKGPEDFDFVAEPVDNDRAKASRRAIVRAAAEIGKAMP